MIANVFLKYSKVSLSNYLCCCNNLPVKFVIFFKISLLFNISIVFSVYEQKFTFSNLKTRNRVMNAKTSTFVNCVEAITYFLYVICVTVP